MNFPLTVSAAIADPIKFWEQNLKNEDSFEALRYAFTVSFFVFAGFLFHYTITGKIWNYYPFEHTTLTVGRSIPLAIVQWMFYASFRQPVLSSWTAHFSGNHLLSNQSNA